MIDSGHKILLPVCYLAPIEYFSVLLKSPSVIFEVNEHFKKQTFRNRCCIYGANGMLNLIIPVQHSGERSPMKEIRIANDGRWQKIHWRSMEAAYRTSPYFEFYEHIFAPFYQKKFEFLTDFNFQLLEEILKILEVEIKSENSSSYQKEYQGRDDYRNFFSPKPESEIQNSFSVYMQVFSGRSGFIPNLSICDLVFNIGPEITGYFRGIPPVRKSE